MVSTIFEAQLALKAYWVSASSYQKHTGLLIVLLAKGFFAWGGPGRPVLMTGPAVTVFTGEIEL